MSLPFAIAAACFALSACAGSFARRRRGGQGAHGGRRNAQVDDRRTTGRPMSPPPSDGDVGQMLSDCCNRRAPAVVMDARTGLAHRCRFESTQAGELNLLADAASETSALQQGAMVAVQFIHQRRTRLFMVPVGSVPTGSSRVLRVRAPRQIAYAEARAAFRVALSSEQAVDVTVKHAAGRARARIVDLSVTGIGLEFTRDKDPGLSTGDEVSLSFRALGYDVQRVATVRRVAAPDYGVALGEAKTSTAAAEYRELLRQLLQRSSGEDCHAA